MWLVFKEECWGHFLQTACGKCLPQGPPNRFNLPWSIQTHILSMIQSCIESQTVCLFLLLQSGFLQIALHSTMIITVSINIFCSERERDGRAGATKRETFYVLRSGWVAVEAGNKCCRFGFKSMSIFSFQLKCWEGTDAAASQDGLCKLIHTNSPVAEVQEQQPEKSHLNVIVSVGLWVYMHEDYDLHSLKWIICVVHPVCFFWSHFLLALNFKRVLSRGGFGIFRKSKLCSSFDLF